MKGLLYSRRAGISGNFGRNLSGDDRWFQGQNGASGRKGYQITPFPPSSYLLPYSTESTAMSALHHYRLRSSPIYTRTESRYTFSPGRESWIAITTVVLSLTLSHLVQRIRAKRSIRLARLQCHTVVTSAVSLPDRCSPRWTTPMRARAKTFLYLYILPSWLYAPETVYDAIWTVVYCAAMVVLAVYQYPFERMSPLLALRV